jgi:hypothetical protein
MVNGAIFLIGPQTPFVGNGEGDQTSLPAGEYMVKVYADSKRRLADDPTLLLGEDDFQGQAGLNTSRWRPGFRQAKSISASALKKE